MSQVHAEQTSRDDVEGRNPPDIEAVDHHVVDIKSHHHFAIVQHRFAVLDQRDIGDLLIILLARNDASGVVRNMEDDKGEQYNTAHTHRLGSIGRLYRFVLIVTLRTRLAIV